MQKSPEFSIGLIEDPILAKNICQQEACKIVALKLSVSWHTAKQRMQQACRERRVIERMPEHLEAEPCEVTV